MNGFLYPTPNAPDSFNLWVPDLLLIFRTYMNPGGDISSISIIGVEKNMAGVPMMEFLQASNVTNLGIAKQIEIPDEGTENIYDSLNVSSLVRLKDAVSYVLVHLKPYLPTPDGNPAKKLEVEILLDAALKARDQATISYLTELAIKRAKEEGHPEWIPSYQRL